MNIEEFQHIVESRLPELIKVSDVRVLADIFNRGGYRMRCQASIISSGKIRKKRSDASLQSFDLSTDGLLITVEPEFEIDDTPGAAPATRPSVVSTSYVPPPPAVAPRPSSVLQPEQVRTVVTSLDRAEAAPHQFVGLKYFRDKILPREAASWVGDEQLRRQVLKELIDQGVIETGKVPNPQSAEFPVTSIKLNRAHPRVEEILRAVPAAAISEFRPIRQSGELASRVLLKDRR